MGTELLPFGQLLPLLLGHSWRAEVEELALQDAPGRVLALPAHAKQPMPRFDASAMDGYAARSQDCRVVGTLLRMERAVDAYAGSVGGAVLPGACVAIGTGGRIPAGADCVIPKEDCQLTDAGIVVQKAAQAGQHIRQCGEEFEPGDNLGSAGLVLDGYMCALLRSAGVDRVHVYQPLRVAVVTTGNEVVAAPEQMSDAHILDTNGPMLAQLLHDDCGIEAGCYGPVPDDPRQLAQVLAKAAETANLVLIAGGVSVGDRDYVKSVLEQQLGFHRLVWGVAVKPGKPLYAARRGATLVVGMPGNPGAVAAQWVTVMRQLVRHLQGRRPDVRSMMYAHLDPQTRREKGKARLLWVTLERDADGEPRAQTLPWAGSHMLRGVVGAAAVAVLPPQEVAQVTRVECWLR